MSLDDAISAVGEPGDGPAPPRSLEDAIADVDAGKSPPKDLGRNDPSYVRAYHMAKGTAEGLSDQVAPVVNSVLKGPGELVTGLSNFAHHPLQSISETASDVAAIPGKVSHAYDDFVKPGGTLAHGLKWATDPVRQWNEQEAPKAAQRTDEENARAYGPLAVQAALPVIGGIAGAGRAALASETGRAVTGAVRGAIAAPGRAAASGLEKLGIGTAEDWQKLHPTKTDIGANSMGAAQSGPLAQFAESSPELQQAAADALKAGHQIDPEAGARHVAADKLGIRLSAGQASQDPAVISDEINKRGVNGMVQVVKDQTDKLKNHFNVVRDETMPDVHTTNMEQHGNTLKEGYQNKAKIADDATDAAYQQLRDYYKAQGGNLQVDAKAMFDQTVADLKSNMQYERAKDLPEFRELSNLADSGQMNFEQFEKHRSNLAQVMRGSDSSNRAVAYTMRKSAEQMPLVGETAEAKSLADNARKLSATQFGAIEADPAYAAAIKDKLSGEQFANKFVTGNAVDPRNIQKMRAMFADDPVAQQTITRAAFDKLRTSAGIDGEGKGVFKFNQFKNAYQGMEGRASELFDPATKNHLDAMRDTARSIYQLPEGNYANHSNTFVAALKDAAENGIRGLAYAKGGPFAVIGNDWLRKKLTDFSAKRVAAKATRPLAGAIVEDTALNTAAKK